MRKISLLLLLFVFFVRLGAQRFPAEGIGYQAMLSKPDKVTYGTKLKNIPIANTDIKVRFELTQAGLNLFTDEHELTTNVNGIFACIIGTGKVNPIGVRLSELDWGKDSVMVRVFVNPGDGEFLFSEQKLWSTAYALHSATSTRSLLDNDTSAQNELQFLSLNGDSIKLTLVSGGISLKPWTDGIAKNAADIISEKNRSEAAEAALKADVDAVDKKYASASDKFTDSFTQMRNELNSNRTDINKNATDIVNIKTVNSRQDDSLAALRVTINTSNVEINNIKTINQQQNDSIAALRTGVNKNASDIVTLKADNKKQDDTLVVLRAGINKNAGDVIALKAENKKQDDTLVVLRSAINKNIGDISDLKTDNKRQDDSLTAIRAAVDKHNLQDKDTSVTNELQDLVFNATTKKLSLSPVKTTGNEIDLSTLGGSDNMGDHKATSNINLNGKYLSGDGDNEGVFVNSTGLVGINTNNPEFSLYNKGEYFSEATFNAYSHSASGAMGALLRSQSVSGVGNFTQLISRGTSSGNWGSGIEFLNQSSGFSNPVVNMKINTNGSVEIPNGTLKVGTVTYPNTHNSTAGQVLTVNSSGAATWQTPSASGSGDNLGNHTATANLKMSSRWLSNDGDNEGIFVATDGKVGVNTTSPRHNFHSRNDLLVGVHPSPIYNADTVRTRYTRTADPGLLIYPEMSQKDAEGGVNCRLMALGNMSGNWSSALSFYTMQSGANGDELRKAMVISRYQRIGIGEDNPSAYIHMTQGDYYKWWNPTSTSAITIQDTNGTNKTRFDVVVGYNNNNKSGSGAAANTVTFDIDGGTGDFFVGDNFQPNGSYSLGSSSYRWSAVWSSNGSIQTSDVREKTNVSNLNYGLAEIMKLRPVSYNWRNEELGKDRKIGFIAQELKKVIPETVQGSEEEGLLGVNYGEITSLTVKAIQEQQSIIEKQQKQIESLLKRIEALEAK